MKRILFICPTSDLKSGGELSNFELIKFLKNSNYQIKVVTPKAGEYNKELSRIGIDNIAFHYDWWIDDIPDSHSTVMNSKAVYDILDTIEDFRPALVVTNTLNVPWGAMAASLENLPHIWIAREFTENEFSYLRNRVNFIDAMSNRVAVNSSELSKYYRSEYGLETDVFYSYVDDSKLKLSSNKSKTKIVSINSVQSRKNQIELIKALGAIKRINPSFDTKVWFIGSEDSKYLASLESEATEQGVKSLIELKGFNHNPWMLVGSDDILIQTSKSESIGRTTTEAMKLGIPVILSDIPGHREAVELGGGLLYSIGDPSDLANKILKLLENKEEYFEKAQSVKEKVKITLSNQETSGRFLSIIDDVIGGDNPSGYNADIKGYVLKYIESTMTLRRECESIRDELSKVTVLYNDERRSREGIEIMYRNIINSKKFKAITTLVEYRNKIINTMFFWRSN